MDARLLYRIASGLLLLFAVGHTLGFLGFKPPSADALAVRDSMNRVSFEFKGATYSWGGFYQGFGLTITVYLLFSALVAWHLGDASAAQPQSVVVLGWSLCAVQLACTVLSAMYFFPAPAFFAGAVVVCLAWATWIAQASTA